MNSSQITWPETVLYGLSVVNIASGSIGIITTTIQPWPGQVRVKELQHNVGSQTDIEHSIERQADHASITLDYCTMNMTLISRINIYLGF